MTNERGDTLVEVLLATAVLSLALVGGLVAMNRGMNIALASVERTQAQALVNAQVSLIQFARDEAVRAKLAGVSYGSFSNGSIAWEQIVNRSIGASRDADGCSTPSAQSYTITNDASMTVAPMSSSNGVASQLPTVGDGLWIESEFVGSPTTSRPYVDFYIKACWLPIGDGPNSQTVTALRQYVP